MKKIISLNIVLIFAIQLQSQNLVPNGDFEQYIHCPQNGGEVDSCLYWKIPTMGSPDYFNTCAGQWCIDVPFNSFGFQNPKSGNAYCGIITYFDYPSYINYREYIEVPLKSPLVANACYHISFYISLAERSQYSCDDIGAYFSDNLITDFSSYLPLTVTPQFNNILVNITDTANWTLIEGEFYAQGDEKFLTIGNFKNDASSTVSIFNTAINVYSEAYLYIDDVSVYKCNTPVYNANAGNDKNMCQGESAVLEMQYFPDYKYKWFDMQGNLQDSTNAVTVYPDSTKKYTLWVKNFLYEESYDTVTVFVDYGCIKLDIPNVFTPNNDGFNDNFYIQSENLAELKMSVYNRWGKKMFETNELSPGWDGTQNGKPCEAGVYFYVADVRFKNGQTASKNGTVTLVR